jgi:hypothetical protein
MGHFLRGFVASPQAAARFRAVVPEAVEVPLQGGFVLFPLTDRLFDALRQQHPAIEDPSWPGFDKLSGPVAFVGRAVSEHGPIAYCETEYFGGVGAQGSIAWADGKVAKPAQWRDYGPINEALQAIGIRREGNSDEFDTIGLGEYRSMSAWEDPYDEDPEEH